MRVVAAAGRGRAVQLLRVRFVKALGISAVPDFIMLQFFIGGREISRTDSLPRAPLKRPPISWLLLLLPLKSHVDDDASGDSGCPK